MYSKRSETCICCLLFVLLALPSASGQAAIMKRAKASSVEIHSEISSAMTSGPRQIASTSSSRPKNMLQTPFQRILEPHLRKMLTAHPKGLSSQFRPLVDRFSSAADNTSSRTFGGFNVAPSYRVGDTGTYDGSYLYGNNPIVATLATDVNGDGVPDLITVQSDGTFEVLLNDGHGGFATPVTNTSATTAGAAVPPDFEFAVAADLNHDGYSDLVVLDDENNELWVFLSQGNGTFASPLQIQAQQQNTTCNNRSLEGVAVRDVTGDGNPDIVVLTTCSILTLVGDGRGHFNTNNVPETDGVQVEMARGAQLWMIGNKLNLVYVNEENPAATAEILYSAIIAQPSKGDGTFGTPKTLITLPDHVDDHNPFMMQFQDLNGDGIPDIAFSCFDGNLYVALGNSNGSFQAPNPSVGGYTAVYPATFALVDVNGDNFPDFVDVEKGYISTYLNDGDGTFGGSSGIAVTDYSIGFSLAYYNELAWGDFNGDGKIDLAFGDYFYNAVSIYFGNGNGSFQSVTQIAESSPVPTVPDLLYVTTALDVNGDGKQDILAVDEGNYSLTGVFQVQSGISDGKGGFAYKTALSGSSIYNLEDILPQTGDFNGDGLQDIILYSETNSRSPVISVSLSNGDGTFQHPVSIQLPNSPVSLPANVVVGDVNGDGKQDLIIAYQGDVELGGAVPSGYYIALGNGDGTFQPATFTAYGSELYLPVLTDVNGDGNPDLILVDDPVGYEGLYPFQVTILLGNGQGGFSSASPLIINTDNLIENAFAADLNHDGKIDLVLFSAGQVAASGVAVTSDTEGIQVLLGNGDGTFNASSSLLAQGIEAVGGAVADFNGDGIPDILFSLYNDAGDTSGTYFGVSTLLGNGDGSFTQLPGTNAIVYVASDPILTGNFLGDNALGVVAVGELGSALLLNQGGTRVALNATVPAINAGEEETLTVTVAPSIPTQSIPSGTVTFWLGSTMLGQESLSNGSASLETSALPIGSDTVTVSYSGDSTFNAYLNAASQVVKIVPALSTITVTASPDPAAPGATVTLQATVASVMSGTATGSVTFYDGGKPLGSASSLSNGVAIYSTSSLPAGNHSVTATYSGDSNFAGSTSAPITELIEAAAITLSVNPNALTVTNGQTGTVALTIGANAAYSGSVTLSAAGAPPNTVVSFSPGTITLANNQTQQIAVTIATSKQSAALGHVKPNWIASFEVFGLTGLFLMVAPRRQRSLSWIVILLLTVLSIISLTTLAGCGGGSKTSTFTAGTSVITIIATPSGSGAAVKTTLNLTVN